MFRIEYTRIAEKQIKKLNTQIQSRIFAVIERARIRPFDHFERLAGYSFYKLRAGDYRIIADLNQSTLTILVVKIGKRENVYDSL